MIKNNKKGFTLVELVVVIAIIAILSSVAIVGYSQFIQRARNSRAQTELVQVVNLLYAEAVVEGIKYDSSKEAGKEINTKTGEIILSVDGGTLIFATPVEGSLDYVPISSDNFKNLMNIYAEGLSGVFELENNKFRYICDDGIGEVTVIYPSATKIKAEGEFTGPSE